MGLNDEIKKAVKVQGLTPELERVLKDDPLKPAYISAVSGYIYFSDELYNYKTLLVSIINALEATTISAQVLALLPPESLKPLEGTEANHIEGNRPTKERLQTIGYNLAYTLNNFLYMAAHNCLVKTLEVETDNELLEDLLLPLETKGSRFDYLKAVHDENFKFGALDDYFRFIEGQLKQLKTYAKFDFVMYNYKRYLAPPRVIEAGRKQIYNTAAMATKAYEDFVIGTYKKDSERYYRKYGVEPIKGI